MSNDEELVPLIQFPDKLQSIFEPHPYKVYYGGRGSSKSWSIARALLILGAATTIRCLCAREYQKSIKESVHQILCDQIQALQLGWYYRVTDREIRNKYNGTLFLFEGLHANSHEIKSKEGLTHCWIEEAENVSKTSWDYLEPTLRTQWLLPWQFWPADTEFTDAEWDMGGRLVDPEIWVSFNPANETDFIYQKFVGGENPKPDFKAPPGSIVQLINWRDNPWFPNNLRAQKDHLAATDPDGYLHIWEGKPRKQSAAQVLRGKYKIEYFEPEGHWSGPYHGTDWGFATDPTAHVKCWVDDKSRRLYVEYEAYGIGVETDDTPALLNEIPDSALYVNRADSARPETISYCRRHGHPRIIAAEKWPGSIEDGVNYLRQEFHEIVIHPRCTHTIEEAKLWSYKVDKNTQDVLPQLEDKNNHCFVGSTLILTSAGWIPISEVKVGDLVLTREGFKPVREVFDNGVKEVETYRFANNKSLTCTPTHNIITTDGKTYAKDITSVSRLYFARKVRSQWTLFDAENTRRSFLTGLLIAGILRVKEDLTESILPVQSARKMATGASPCTLQYGKVFMVPFLQVIMCIIRTATRSITKLKIWNSSPLVPTALTTRKSIIQRNQKWSKLILPIYNRWQQLGTEVLLGVTGIKNKLQRYTRTCNLKLEFVSNVVLSTFKRNQLVQNQDSVQTNVQQNGEGAQVSMISRSFALAVVKPSRVTNIASSHTVQESVPKQQERVYDLAVEDCHEYVANGVLVSNCWDAVRYALAPLIKGKVKFDGNWWRRWSGDVEDLFTIKMVTVTVDEVSEGAAELRSVFQVWGVKGLEAMYLLSEQEFYGTLPVIIQNTTDAWQNLAKDPKTVKAPSELWADAKSVGQTLIRTLRQHGIPAREWETEDKTILEPDYRAKLASVHLAAGRVFVPEGPCAVVTEIEGLNTNAMSLALLIWQLRGGGKQ